MPELPEVETTVRGLQKLINGQTIKTVVFHREKIRYPLDKEWIKLIEGKTIQSISRRAKIVVFELSDGFLLWHLGMTGSLRVSDSTELKRNHDHIEMTLHDLRILRFHDPRRFGYLKWFADTERWQKSVAHYGLEPLSENFNGRYLWQKSRTRSQCVKNFIMDQQTVVGVGNIYACEALFAAKIRPQLRCNKLSMNRYEILIQCIQSVLKKAIVQGGTTLKDFENANAEPGYFQQSLSVYGHAGKPCFTCGTTIKSLFLGGRNSFYCPHCQS